MRLFLLLILLNLSCFAQQPEECKWNYKIAAMERDAHIRLMNRGAQTVASNNFDVSYYRCEWEVDPAINHIGGTVTVYFRASANATSITLDLTSFLQVDSVIQRGNQIPFSRPTDALTIQFPSPVNSGSIDSVSIFYQGAPANTGFGSFIQTTHNAIPVIWTLSEPYGARDWWPCKNGLDDKADSIDVYITSPVAYKAASNGLLQSETPVEGGTKTKAHWKHRYPIATYLVCMAVTNYVVFNNSVQLGNTSLPMVTYCYPEYLSDFQSGTQPVLDALQLFNQYFGEYPFIKEKYGHVQFGWGGGMEHQTSTFVINTTDWLTAHELGHQWFGDKITCGSWQHIWLNEGFATYLSRFYMETAHPENTIAARESVVEDITSSSGGSVFVDDTTSIGRIFSGRLSYNKGSYLLNMLRLKLGDSAFFNGLKKYQQDPALKYGFARTSDLQRNLEEVSGQSLTTFFDQWFYKEGYPSFQVKWSTIGSGSVKIKINQLTSHPSVSFFEIPLPLLFKNATQQKLIVFDSRSNGEEFIRTLGFLPDSVLIDPNYDIISAYNVSQKITGTNTGNPVVEIYPNPMQSPVTVYLHDFTDPSADVRLYNMAGQLLYKQQVQLLNGSEIITLNTNAWPRGKYIVKVISASKTFTKQLLK